MNPFQINLKTIKSKGKESENKGNFFEKLSKREICERCLKHGCAENLKGKNEEKNVRKKANLSSKKRNLTGSNKKLNSFGSGSKGKSKNFSAVFNVKGKENKGKIIKKVSPFELKKEILKKNFNCKFEKIIRKPKKTKNNSSRKNSKNKNSSKKINTFNINNVKINDLEFEKTENGMKKSEINNDDNMNEQNNNNNNNNNNEANTIKCSDKEIKQISDFNIINERKNNKEVKPKNNNDNNNNITEITTNNEVKNFSSNSNNTSNNSSKNLKHKQRLSVNLIKKINENVEKKEKKDKGTKKKDTRLIKDLHLGNFEAKIKEIYNDFLDNNGNFYEKFETILENKKLFVYNLCDLRVVPQSWEGYKILSDQLFWVLYIEFWLKKNYIINISTLARIVNQGLYYNENTCTSLIYSWYFEVMKKKFPLYDKEGRVILTLQNYYHFLVDFKDETVNDS